MRRIMNSAIYRGLLRHRRFFPKRHEFTYPVFMAYLDIDRIPALMRISRFCGYNRWNWASFYDSDHFGDASVSLRDRLRQDADRNGVTVPDGPIYLLTNLRYLGHNFNPVSFYYCFGTSGSLEVVLAE